MICSYCGYPMIFKADEAGELFLDRLTADELIALIDQPEFLRARALVMMINQEV